MNHRKCPNDSQQSLAPTADASETCLDWQRIEALSPKINIIARHWAARTGRDVEDIVQTMTLAIAEQALRMPNFLQQKDNYILNRGSWRAVDALRKQWQDDSAAALDDEWMGDGGGVRDGHNLDDIILALSLENRGLLSAIIAAGDTVLKRSGALNVSALARHLGLSNSMARRKVHRLRQELAVAGYSQ